MNDVAIRVENLSKQYKIGGAQQYHDTLRDTIADFGSKISHLVRRPSHSKSNLRKANSDYIWALKAISFEVKQGEVIGFIGRNGAGKSTLLKILSRITAPTTGQASIYGRVGSLLEVGTGFHPELTGRENIYLNGAILGMRKPEIKQKFDEIVAFAELEKFLDTPVKRYSSGMYVRLAFAVAAHLEPEILLVDEVLAVGDIRFQKKCLGKMRDVEKSGRTVLFTSHQMNQIRRLCQRVIWLDAGQIQQVGATSEVVSAYEAAMSSIQLDSPERSVVSHMRARFIRWEIIAPRSEQSNILTTMGPVTVRFIVQVNNSVRKGHHGIALFNSEGQLLWGTAMDDLHLQRGNHEFVYTLTTLPIRPGAYHWQVSLYDEKGLADHWTCIPELLINTKPVTHPRDEWAGILNIPYRCSINQYNSSGQR
jgi:lipopolysaccharide transport system ATP-binding protein